MNLNKINKEQLTLIIMELALLVAIEHLIDFHDIGIRLVALKRVSGAIEAKDNTPWARRSTGRSVYFLSCVWHNGRL